MTRKDYELIAGVVRDMDFEEFIHDSYAMPYERGIRMCRAVLASHFAAALADTNPRFDRDRFLRACGVAS